MPLRRRLNVMGDDFRDLSLRPGGRAASVDAAISKKERQRREFTMKIMKGMKGIKVFSIAIVVAIGLSF